MHADPIAIVDAHLHFLDAQAHRYPLFQQPSPGFEALVGNYRTLPRRYLPEHYLQDVQGLNVVKTLWAEFLSDDAVREVQWAHQLSKEAGHPHGLIARVDFLSPDLEQAIEAYAALPRVRAVRQHLGWHPSDARLRFAARPDLLADATWQKRLAVLRHRDLRCELEVFAPQLPGFTALASAYGDLQFVLPLMGWPLDLTEAGRRRWKRDLAALSGCENVAVKIFGLECLFGLNWTLDQVRPWILDTIELFGPGRCMFASHLPIAKLACSVQELYGAYFEVVSGFSAAEKQQLFQATATAVYGL